MEKRVWFVQITEDNSVRIEAATADILDGVLEFRSEAGWITAAFTKWLCVTESEELPPGFCREVNQFVADNHSAQVEELRGLRLGEAAWPLIGQPDFVWKRDKVSD